MKCPSWALARSSKTWRCADQNEISNLKVLGKNRFTVQIRELFKTKEKFYLILSYNGKYNLEQFLLVYPNLTVGRPSNCSSRKSARSFTT